MVLKKVKVELTVFYKDPVKSVSELVMDEFGSRAVVVGEATLKSVLDGDKRYVQEVVNVL